MVLTGRTKVKTNSRLKKMGSRSSFSGLLASNNRPVFTDPEGDNLCLSVSELSIPCEIL